MFTDKINIPRKWNLCQLMIANEGNLKINDILSLISSNFMKPRTTVKSAKSRCLGFWSTTITRVVNLNVSKMYS